ncbi:hypothetical protein QUB02_06985 [Microcoleus sp. D3_18_C1]
MNPGACILDAFGQQPIGTIMDVCRTISLTGKGKEPSPIGD